MTELAELGAPVAATLQGKGIVAGHGDRQVLHGVDVDLEPGRCTAVLGANGSGKSTLLRCLAGLHPLGAGQVLVDGRAAPRHRSRALARQVGFLPQSPTVPVGVSVGELVAYGRHPHRGLLSSTTGADRAAVAWAARVAGVDGLLDRPVAELSGGERQRVWLAMCLAQRTPVVLLDEPTTYLDVRHQLDVLALVGALAHDHGLTVGVVLHDLDQAAALADHLVVLADGVVAARGAPADVLTPALVRHAFGVDADVTTDPRTGRPTCRLHRLVEAPAPSLP